MAKKKRKKFQKTQLLSLFNAQNYQKVISKVKQFQIDGMSDDELHKILTDSYYALAESNFLQGDIVRAIRDIDSLLKIDNNITFRITQLKYLCYINNFKGAVELAEELLSLKPTAKLKKEIIFFYFMANLYNGNYELDRKLLKTLSSSKQLYILGFCEFLQDNTELALEYFDTFKPRAKDEKKNLEAIKAIISNQELDFDNSGIKPFYRLLLTGDSTRVVNSKSAREAKKELGEAFKSREKNSALRSLVELKAPASTDVILKQNLNKEQELKLIYNNVVLLANKKQYIEALEIFIKYRASFIKFIESVMLFITIKEHIENKRSDAVVLGFISNYLKLHHKKIAPFQIDTILLFLTSEEHVKASIDLAKEYGRENFVFLVKEIRLMTTFSPHLQIKFNKVMKRYSSIDNKLLRINSHSFTEADKYFDDLDHSEKSILLNRILIFMILLENIERPHKKYKSTLFKMFKALAMLMQNFSYHEEQTNYLKLSTLIEHYIEYFSINRVDLAIDIKALFVSISKENSVRVKGNKEESNLFKMHLSDLWGHINDEKKYNFNEHEYNLSLIKKACISNLERGTKEPFRPLIGFEIYTYHNFLHEFIMDLIAKSIEFGRTDSDRIIDEILKSLEIESLSDSYYRDEFPTKVKEYAKKDIKIAIIYFNHAIRSVNPRKKEFVWYLKWADTYINLVKDYSLEKDALFHMVLTDFFNIQYKRNFKSINARYKRNLKKFKNIERKKESYFD